MRAIDRYYKRTHQNNPVSNLFDLMTKPLCDLGWFETETSRGFLVDIKDDGDHYSLKADLPGFNKEDVSLNFDRGVLTIKATHQENKEEKDEQGVYLLKERSLSSTTRSFAFDDVDENKSEASFEDGVLHLTLAKKAHNEGSTIQIK